MENYIHYKNRWKKRESIWSRDNNRASGVAILFKTRAFHIQKVERVIAGRKLLVNTEGHGIKLRVINVYCPTDCQEWINVLQTLQTLVFCGKEIIIGGDFNCIIDKGDRISTSIRTAQLDTSSHTLKEIIENCNLVDVYRLTNFDNPGYTWTNGRTFSRIDFLLTIDGAKAIICTIEPTAFSDHHKLTCSLDISESFKVCADP